jgi:UDP-N-acetylmuramoylalanine--D-glutamate ligase
MDNSLVQKKVLVVGAGESGLAAARLLVAQGAIVRITDLKTAQELGGVVSQVPSQVEWLWGPGHLEVYLAADLIVISPGVPFNQAGLEAARAKGVEVIGEMELAYREQSRPILAVTGSNGKTTVTSLVGHILAKYLKAPPFVGGNIGNPLANLALKEVLGQELPSLAILEVSSFQLETTSSFRAKGAAFLNLTPDHLDRHGDLNGYFQTKMKIFDNQENTDIAVINEDDPFLAGAKVKAVRYGFSRRNRPNFGGYISEDKGETLLSLIIDSKVMAEAKWSDFLLTGEHNQENVLAAACLALAAGLSPQEALAAGQDFAPGDHRLQMVGEIRGVKYYDDSKGTNVGAVARALQNFAVPVVLIAGGRDKGLDFRYLKPYIEQTVKDLVLIGEAQGKMRLALNGAAPIHLADSLEEAVKLSAKLAAPGEVVLLSPACASFDMFKDYKDRGDSFARAVKKLGEKVES